MIEIAIISIYCHKLSYYSWVYRLAMKQTVSENRGRSKGVCTFADARKHINDRREKDIQAKVQKMKEKENEAGIFLYLLGDEVQRIYFKLFRNEQISFIKNKMIVCYF